MIKEKKYILDAQPIKKDVDNETMLGCLAKTNQDIELDEKDIENFLAFLINTCGSFQHMIYVLNNFGIYYVKPIDTKKTLSDGVENHVALIIKFGKDKVYLVDPNYRKFFLKENCVESKYKVEDNYICSAPHPGYYYLQNPEFLPIAKEIIENGYIKLNPTVAKAYAESFYTTRKGYFLDWESVKSPNIDDEIYLFTLMIGDISDRSVLSKRIS